MISKKMIHRKQNLTTYSAINRMSPCTITLSNPPLQFKNWLRQCVKTHRKWRLWKHIIMKTARSLGLQPITAISNRSTSSKTTKKYVFILLIRKKKRGLYSNLRIKAVLIASSSRKAEILLPIFLANILRFWSLRIGGCIDQHHPTTPSSSKQTPSVKPSTWPSSLTIKQWYSSRSESFTRWIWSTIR